MEYSDTITWLLNQNAFTELSLYFQAERWTLNKFKAEELLEKYYVQSLLTY